MSRDIKGNVKKLSYFTSSASAPTVCSMGTVGSALINGRIRPPRGPRGISLTYVHNTGQRSRRRVSRETCSGPP